MTHPLLEALQVNEAQFIALRRQFHQQPEIGFEEHQTSNEVARLLGEWGYEVHRGLAGTGVVGTLRVGSASISARRPRRFFPWPTRSVPTTPVPARPR